MNIYQDVISSLDFGDTDKPLKLHSRFLMTPEQVDGITALCVSLEVSSQRTVKA